MLETDTSQHACNDNQTDVFQAEKQHKTMVLVQKFKTSSFDIVVREPLGFGQKSSSEQWLSNRKYMSLTQFLSRTEGSDDHFNQKQKSTMPCANRSLASPTTLEKSMTLNL